MAGRDQQSCLAIGREVHVARQQRLAEGAAHRLLAHVLHVERRLALPLRHQHARVEGAQRHHVAQAGQQRLIAQETGPGADRLPVAVEHADDGIGEIADGFGIGVHRWACDRAGPRDLHAREVRGAAWADRRFRHMQLQRAISGHLVALFPLVLSRSQSWSRDATARKMGFMIGNTSSARRTGGHQSSRSRPKKVALCLAGLTVFARLADNFAPIAVLHWRCSVRIRATIRERTVITGAARSAIRSHGRPLEHRREVGQRVAGREHLRFWPLVPDPRPGSPAAS